MCTRRPLRSAAVPIRRSISSLHHCTPAGSVLDGDPGTLDIGGDRLDHGHLLGRRDRRPQQSSRDAGAGRGREGGQQAWCGS
jgi:hypothetical protein